MDRPVNTVLKNGCEVILLALLKGGKVKFSFDSYILPHHS
jgi:hypothetical protein